MLTSSLRRTHVIGFPDLRKYRKKGHKFYYWLSDLLPEKLNLLRLIVAYWIRPKVIEIKTSIFTWFTSSVQESTKDRWWLWYFLTLQKLSVSCPLVFFYIFIKKPWKTNKKGSFGKLLWELSKAHSNFQAIKMVLKSYFKHFLSFQRPLQESLSLFKLLHWNLFIRSHLGT